MDICNKCGEMIEFRYIDGRPKPIHLSGWCRGYISNSNHNISINKYSFEDLTRKTQCPKCSEEVFFIKHNGGSVWVDSLGWPWPKHACFTSEMQSKLYNYFEKKTYLNDKKSFTGIVVKSVWIKGTANSNSKIELKIKYSNGEKIISIPGIFTVENLENTIAIVNLEQKKIAFSSYAESDIIDDNLLQKSTATTMNNHTAIIIEKEKNDSVVFNCIYCKKSFSLSINFDNHMSKAHGEEAWQKHIKDKKVLERLNHLTRCMTCNELVKNINKHMNKVHKIQVEEHK